MPHSHLARANYELFVEVASGIPADAIAHVRATYGSAPVAYVAQNEAEAMEAISSGADEAMVMPAIDRKTLLALIDRTLLRAEIRREQERMQTSFTQAERLAALGTVVASVAHEINNPLTAVLLSIDTIRATLQPLLEAEAEIQRLAGRGHDIRARDMCALAEKANTGLSHGEGSEILDEMAVSVQSIAAIVRDLRIFARTREDGPPEVVSVPEVIDQVLRIVGREVTAHGGVIERDYTDDVPSLVVPRIRLAQVLTNILINAAHAIREVERPVHQVRISLRVDAEALAVSISDTGPGIPPEAIDRIFDPFYTTKRESVGTGLGLAISRSIMRRMGGDLIVDSVHGVGATFVAMAPLPDNDTLQEAYEQTLPLPRLVTVTARFTVMVVDDDPRLLHAYSRALRDKYDVILAGDGQEAIDLLSSGTTADVLVTDLMLGQVDGVKLFTWLSREQPELAQSTIFATAATTADNYADFLRPLHNQVLEKPVFKERLIRAITRAVRSK